MPTIEIEPTPEEIAAEEKLQKQRERKRKNYRTYVEKRQQELAQEAETQNATYTGGVALEKVETVY